MTNKSKVNKVYAINEKTGNTGEAHLSKVDKVYIVNADDISGGNGGEFNGTVPWDDVTDKPTQYEPSPHDHDERYSRLEHNHDDRYNTKEDVQEALDFVANQIEGEQGRVQINEEDTLGYLGTKIDNTTVVVESNELKVKGVDGLTVGASDISTWLAGTDVNIQTQIDDLSDQIMAAVSGMNYRGKAETYAELLSYGNNVGGDLVVVLNDESREGSRTMYVYSEDKGMWEFIGAFAFSDKFTTLSETPTSLEGQDGKVLKARGERVVLEGVSYIDLTDKPESTITQIDDAVAKRHEHINGDLLDTYNQTNADLRTAVSQSHTHSNKSAIDRIGINASEQLTIDGVPYVPAEEPKGYLYARASSGSIATNGTWRWIRSTSRGITLQDNGVFVLEEGKTYQITVSASVTSLTDWKKFGLIDTETRSAPPEAPNEALVMAVNSSRGEAHSGVLSLIITPTSTRNFGITILGSQSATSSNINGRTSLVITEI